MWLIISFVFSIYLFFSDIVQLGGSCVVQACSAGHTVTQFHITSAVREGMSHGNKDQSQRLGSGFLVRVVI